MNEDLKAQIIRLKKEKNAVIMAHYYVDGEIQEIADYVGDSYFLAKKATEIPEDVVIFCGVLFMGESVKILNPDKKVVMADQYADCPMAHMIDIDTIRKTREEYPDVAVVCYVNSTAEVKAESDICVTSSNAVRIVEKLPNKNIFFIPDNHLGHFVANQAPLVLAHPECTEDVLAEADFIGSTSQIIEYATKSDNHVFIICTEMGIFYELHRKNPEKIFYSVGHRQFCPNMKRIKPKSILTALQELAPEVELGKELRQKAELPLKRMLELAE